MKGKKVFIAVSALLGATALLGGCKTKKNNEYDALNKMLDMNYSQIVLTVTNDFGGDAVLVSEYTMKFSESGVTINYSVERFSEISFDTTVPAKTTLTGEAFVSAGGDAIGIGVSDDDEVNLDEVPLLKALPSAGLDFNEKYFENADLTGSYFRADLKDADAASAFMNADVQCTEMKVFATFFDYFYNIKITFKTEGALVEYNYAFKK